MPSEPATFNTADLVRATAIFRELSDEQLTAIWSRAKVLNLIRGAVLVRQNTLSDSVFVVVSGRFEVWVEGQDQPINEIGVGEPIGEIGFFSGAPRTATIVAARDSVVLELDRPSFNTVAREVPAIYQTLLSALARRVAGNSARVDHSPRVGVARTAAVITGGNETIPPGFFEQLHRVVTGSSKGLVLDHASLREHFPGHDADHPNVSGWLNALENENELVVFLCDQALTDWTRKAIRQADQVIVVVAGAGPKALNPVEEFAFSIHPPARRRLVRVHEQRSGAVEGTAAWLRDREVAMHHQVALEDDRDFKSLHRFLTGRALGFVAAGGGGFGPAHIGIYKAFLEHGVHFDILGGASVGAAVLAGFALLKSPEEVDLAAHDIFVTSKGFKHFTLPRYALLDHIVFDEALRRAFMGIAIEDAWRPYFAVTTLLDGSWQGPYLMRSGPLWKAVRASGSLPAILPPVISDDGRLLVDGGVVDNIPLSPMNALKTGPNLVAHFGLRGRAQRFEVDYMSIPGRWQLARSLLTRTGRGRLPPIPGPIGVLQRCLVLNQDPDRLPTGPLDLVLPVPELPGATLLDFDRHFEVFEGAYQWCKRRIDELGEQNDAALAAILATRD
jgi:NTE family protein